MDGQMKNKIDYSRLAAGDILGTTRLDPLGCIIRATEAGLFNIFNMKVSSHIMIVCQDHDLFYGMELTWPKIRMIDLPVKWVFHARIPGVSAFSDKVNQWILKCHSMNIKYDWKGLLEFWHLTDDEKEKWYCSEFAREMMRFIGVPFPFAWEQKVSPWDMQQYCKEKNLMVS